MRENHYLSRVRQFLKTHLLIKKRMARQLRQPKSTNKKSALYKKRILLPIIETTHYQHQHMLIIAKALQLRGADVKVLVCGEILNGCEIKSFRNRNDHDPCWSCRFNAKHTLPLYDLPVLTLAECVDAEKRKLFHLRAKYLKKSGERIVSHGIYLNQAVQDSVTRYYYGAVSKSEKEFKKVKENHISTALLSIEAAKKIDEHWKPDIVLCNMFCYSAWHPFYAYYKKNGDRFISISLSEFNFKSITIQIQDLFNSKRYKKWFHSRKTSYLCKKEKLTLETFINSRICGRAEIFQINKYYKNNNKNDNIINNIDQKKRNIFLFTNIHWDVGLPDLGGLFPDVISWVAKTILMVAKVKNIHLYIKTHPGEEFSSAKSLKTVSQLIREKIPSLPSNVTLIEPCFQISPYKLFPFIDVGVTFTGTVGLEMLCKGLPVITTGRAPYCGLGLVAEPKSLKEYYDYLVGKRSIPRPKMESVELFAFFYFIKTKIPWLFTKQAYADNFNGFNFENLNEISQGHNTIIDHLCECIINYKNSFPESWPDNHNCSKN